MKRGIKMKTKKSLKNVFLFVLALGFVFFLNAGLSYAFAEEVCGVKKRSIGTDRWMKR